MSDLIDRQAVLDALKEHRALYCDNTPDAFSELSYAEKSRVDELDTAIATIINLPSVSVLENPNKWIPVSDRLPEETKTKGHGLCHVLVTHTYAGITRTHQAVFTQGKFLKLETYKEDNTVVAWMPLPDPYKAERGEC